MPPPTPILTPRLRLTPLAPIDLAAFHALVTDPHIRRYMMDGEVLPLEWAAQQIDASLARFETAGTGLWLTRDRQGGDGAIGFCGFMALPGTGLGSELVYALREDRTGAGLATEMARAVIDQAHRDSGLRYVSASVDAVNASSVRTLENLGFHLAETRQGVFGDMLVFALDLSGA